MRKTRSALLHSAIALLLCISMLIGSTFAWFTDSVTSGTNIIQSGNLDIEMYWTDDLDSGNWYNVEEDAHNTIFSYDNWEPGYTDVKYIKLVNNGSLAMNYKLTLTPQGSVGKLAEVINVYFSNSEVELQQRSDLSKLRAIGLLNNVLNGGATAEGTLLPAGEVGLHPAGEVIMTIAMNMITTAGNDYQNESSGEFTVTALATQAAFEKDSFGSDYDDDAEYPAELVADKATAAVTPVDGKVPAGGVTLTGANITAFVPAGAAMAPGADKLTLAVTPMEHTTSDIKVVNDEVLIPVDVHIEGLAEDNTVPAIISLGEVLPKYLNMGNYHLFHVEDGVNNEMTLVDSEAQLTQHNQYTYDPLTGEVTVAMASFSEVALVADTSAAWEGGEDYTWYDGKSTPYTIANADQLYAFAKIVGGMAGARELDSFTGDTIKLLSDINLNGGKVTVEEKTKVFYPIGYYNKVNGETSGIYDRDDAKVEGTNGVESSVSSFEGTFDGNGHTISDFYQNTWEMFGDYNSGYTGTPNYYKDAMGLFGYVNGGKVMNLTVDSFDSDGEFTPTGVIAAYADGNATFENIAITNCNPRVYNTGNGGIIGIAGDTSTENDDHITLKNITIDNSNKISALWGSYDVACGGLVGMYRGNVDGSGNATGDTISFNNCHVSAIIDVYNDVCGNYQYYAYRYAGMIIGSVRHNTTNTDGKTIPNMAGISATGCTVNYGDWNDYYYCEFVKNGHPSYSGPNDYKFSRVPNSEIDTTKGKENATCIGHNHTDVENNQAIYLPFHQLFTGYSWGVSSIGLEELDGIENITVTIGKEESELKFKANFDAFAEITAGTPLTVGNLFSAIADINDSAVQVAVSALDGKGITAVYEANTSNWTKGTLTFDKVDGLCSVTIQDYNFCKPTTVILMDGKLHDVFAQKFTGDFLYRVGNQNPVSLSSLFAENGVAINDSKVEVKVTGGTYTANTTDWTQGTIQFSNTGIATVTIQDTTYANITTLKLEVVDAMNATTAASATKNNVVLLQDCGFSALEVSGGYTLYGNGFAMTCSSDSVATDRTYSFVELKGGTLDNVRIVTPNFSHAIMYETNKTQNGNPSSTDSSGKTRYYNIRSAVLVSANSTITNSYISGGRAAIYATTGTLTIENSTIYGGAVANIQAEASSSLVLEDVTLIQKPIKATVNDTSKTVMGLSVVTMCDTSGVGTPITLKGYLHQYAWANNDYKTYVPSDAQDVVTEVLGKSEFVHSITYDDGETRASVNLGFAYMPNGTTKTSADNLIDNRTDNIPYGATTVKTIATIYTYKNTSGTDTAVSNEPAYHSTTQGNVAPNVTYTDTNENRVFTTTYDETKSRWKATLKVDVDAGAYNFSFENLLVQKYGKDLSYTVKTEAGDAVDKNAVISLNSAVANTYILTIADDQIYDKNGNNTGKTVETTYVFELLSTKTSLPAPTWTSTTPTGTPYIVVDTKGGDWNCAVPVLDGVAVKYWSKKQNKEVELDLATVVSAAGLSAGLQNGSNNTITITVADEYTLTITTSGFKTNDNGKPVVVDEKLYFTVSSSSNYVSTSTTSRTVSISYSFTDANNSDSISLSSSFNVVYADYKLTQYKYSDFCNGKLTEASSCFTPDTLITLADGTQKRIDQVSYDDKLQVWDFNTGSYSVVPVIGLINHGEDNYRVITLNFDDGTTVRIIDKHGFFDTDLKKFVFIDEENVEQYIGHNFVEQDGNSYTTTKLVSYSVTKEYTTAYSIYSYDALNAIAGGMLTITPMPGVDSEAFFGCLVVGDNMMYDQQAIQKYIEKYGLYTYEELAPYGVSYDQFVGAKLAFLKVIVGEGIVTLEEALMVLAEFIPAK